MQKILPAFTVMLISLCLNACGFAQPRWFTYMENSRFAFVKGNFVKSDEWLSKGIE